MCRPPSPSPSTYLLSLDQNTTAAATVAANNQNPNPPSDTAKLTFSTNANDGDADTIALRRLPSPAEIATEVRAISKISGPTLVTGILLYSRAMVSMLFLGYLGELELAGGSLAIGFANITGYSVLSGLAMGMEPICGQAFGAQQWKVLGLTFHRTVLLLLSASLPISLLWINMHRLLLGLGQDGAIAATARTFILFSLPDLLSHSFLHPIRIYLRTQNSASPIAVCSALAVLLHLPANLLLVVHFKMGVAGVALSSAWTNFSTVFCLAAYLRFSATARKCWVSPSRDAFRGWSALLRLAVPTCVSVCLEWWWYEIMVILCGLLANPKATVASMGILIQTTALVYVFPSALSLGVSTRVGNELGANRPGRARIASIVAMGCAGLLGMVAMSFAILVRNRWATLFTKDMEILKLTAVALPIIGLCELGNCPQTTGCGVLRGTARPKVGANINLGSFYMVGMPVAVGLGFFAGVGFSGLWMGLLAAQAACAVAMILVLVRTDWVAQAERARQLMGSATESGGKEVAVVSGGGGEEEPLVSSNV